MRMYRLFKT